MRIFFEHLELENVTQMFTFFLPGQRKILPRVDMWAEKNRFDWFYYELLYFYFVNVCNAKSWNCSTKMIEKGERWVDYRK